MKSTLVSSIWFYLNVLNVNSMYNNLLPCFIVLRFVYLPKVFYFGCLFEGVQFGKGLICPIVSSSPKYVSRCCPVNSKFRLISLVSSDNGSAKLMHSNTYGV